MTVEDDREKLKSDYSEKIPELFSALGRLLVKSDKSSESLEILKEAHRTAHSLNGTAGSIGFSDVSSAASALEAALKEIIRLRRLTSVPATLPYPHSSVPPSSAEAAASDGDYSTIVDVLVVDDDETFLTAVQAMGKENLIHVHAATGMKSALNIAQTCRLDAAVIDIILNSGDNAFEIARSLRALPNYQALPIGFISVDSSVSQRIAAVHAGASLFLDKPLTSIAFQTAVRRLIPSENVRRAKVLVVDDDEDFLIHMRALLSAENIDVSTLHSAMNIVDDVAECRPDLILLDVVMDKVGGFDACRVLRSTEAWRDIPILMLTVYGNRKMLVQSFAAGADDFIEKPIIKEELMARIRLRLDRIQMYRERADTDALTGLPTRRPFLELFKMRLAEGVRFSRSVSLCLLDLDHFKEVNDTYGHLAGDRVLSAMGLLLGSRFRTMDVRGRWGGEEFVVVFYGEEAETAKMIINRVLAEFREMTFQGDHGEEFHVTFSAGIASFPAAGRTVEELFRHVDRKLYSAKDQGRNTIDI
jgi:diguanylate cyclase (GGDEF)-like protein